VLPCGGAERMRRGTVGILWIPPSQEQRAPARTVVQHRVVQEGSVAQLDDRVLLRRARAGVACLSLYVSSIT